MTGFWEVVIMLVIIIAAFFSFWVAIYALAVWDGIRKKWSKACGKRREALRIMAARRQAHLQVVSIFKQAEIKMEEAAGHRRLGERRIGDSLGSWRSW